MTEKQAIERIRYRIDTASEIAGKGEDGNAFEDMEMAIKTLETVDKIENIIKIEQQPTSCEHTKLKSFEMIEKIISDYQMNN